MIPVDRLGQLLRYDVLSSEPGEKADHLHVVSAVEQDGLQFLADDAPHPVGHGPFHHYHAARRGQGIIEQSDPGMGRTRERRTEPTECPCSDGVDPPPVSALRKPIRLPP